MKTKPILTIVLIGIFLSNCGSGQIKTLETKSDEAIIIARAFINNDGVQVNTKWNFLWDERLWGKNAVWVKKDGYIFTKLPAGKHFITLLQYNQFRKNIPDNYLSINVEENKIYYIGDFTFDWNISRDDASKYGVAGAIADSKEDGIKISVHLEDNFEETTKYFNEKFKNDRPIEKQLMKIEIE